MILFFSLHETLNVKESFLVTDNNKHIQHLL